MVQGSTEAEGSGTASPQAQVDESPERAMSPLRRMLTVGWVVTVVLFTLARLLLAQGTLAKYGLNIWVFGVIDLVTAFPYALGTAKVVGAFVDHDPRAIGKWAAVASAAFIAPYLYVAWAGTGGAFPPAVYVALVILIVAFGSNAIWSVSRKVRAERAEAEGDGGGSGGEGVEQVHDDPGAAAQRGCDEASGLTNPARS